MRIDASIYGLIIIDGMKYDHDVVISGGRIQKREEGSVFTRNEIQKLLKENPDIIILGTGHSNICSVEPSAVVEAQVKGMEIIAKPTTAAIEEFNKLARRKKLAAIFHVV